MDRSENQLASGRKKSAGLLWLSICLNVLLAAVAARLLAKPASRLPVPTAGPVVVSERIEETVRTNVPSAAAYVTNRFHWRQVESTNYETYAANLRGVGCPEKTVRDILRADIDKSYTARHRTIGRNQPFWMAGKQRQLAERAQAAEREALEQEHAALVQRLLGEEWISKNNRLPDQLETEALVRWVFGPMSEEKFQRVVALFGKYDSLKDRLNDRTGRVYTDEDEAEMRRLVGAMKRELNATLTPAEHEELMARAGAMEMFENDGFSGFVEITPVEARRIALARTEAHDMLRDMFNDLDDDSAEEQQLREAQFNNTVRAVLGEARFAEFELAQNRDFREIATIGKEHSLPKTAAVEVYQIRRLALEEAERIRADPGLDNAAKQAELATRQPEIQKEVLRALGPKAYGEYLQRGGAWVTNLNQR